MTDLRQTKEWAEWLSRTGWTVERVGGRRGKKLFVYIRQLPLVKLSFLKLQRFDSLPDWEEFSELKRKYHVLMASLEPVSETQAREIEKKGYKLTKDAYLPTKTRVIDLTKKEAELIRDMSENFRRVVGKRSETKTDKIDSEEFYSGWKKWSKTLVLSEKQFEELVKAYGRKVEFWGAVKNKEILSAVMLLFTDDSCYYYQTWTSDVGRKGSEHVRLVFETMKRAKKLGKKFYNFEGVQDKRFPLKKWEGFTEFKRRFGGEEVAYPGCFSKWF